MKKFFVSSAVIIAFAAYSLYQRVFGIQTTSIIVPKTISSAPTLTPTPTSPAPTQSNLPQTSIITSIPQDTPTPTPTPRSGYKDGTYTGDVADAFYGNIQVQATIANGKLTNVQFLQYPNDRGYSIAVNSQADPMLAQEAIQSQNANVDIVSGATDSSQAFVQSLQSALNKAKS